MLRHQQRTQTSGVSPIGRGTISNSQSKDVDHSGDIPEDQDTLEGNSLQKAQFIYDNYGIDCLADDSGLEVEALNWAPGVFSARFAGLQKSDENNIDKLFEKLKDTQNRRARFRCVITLMINRNVKQFEGVVNGSIDVERRGDEGFGYDAVFIPDGFDRTFAQMTSDEKNSLSHRGTAVSKLVGFLNDLN